MTSNRVTLCVSSSCARHPVYLRKIFPKHFTVRGSHFFLKSALSVTASVCPFPLAMQPSYLFMCLPGDFSTFVSQVRPFPLAMQHFYSFLCQVISLLLFPRFGACTAGVRPFPLAMQHFYSFVSQVCHCWCPPFSAGHVAFLFMCLPSLSISVHVSPRYVTAGVRPFPLAMQHFYSFVSQVCHWWCPPFSAGNGTFLFIPETVHCC